MAALIGVKVDPGRGRDAGILDHLLAELHAVVGEIRNVGIDIERAIGRRDPAKTHVWQGGKQQFPVAGIGGDIGFQLVGAVHRHQSGVLAERGRGKEQIAPPGLGGGHRVLGNHHPAQAPGRHAEVFGETVDHQRLGQLLKHRGGVHAIADPVIDLVRNDGDPTFAADLGNGAQLFARDNRAGRVGRAGQDQSLGCGIERRERSGSDLKTLGFAARQLERNHVQCAHGVAIGNIAGARHGYPIPRVEAHVEGQNQRGRGAAGEDYLRRFDPDPIPFGIVAANPRLEFAAFPVAHRIAVEHLMRASDGRAWRAG